MTGRKESALTIKTLVKKSEYHDSVTLMLVARELTKFPGVIDVGVIMATEANKALLKESGLLTPEAQSATPNDLVIAVSADDDAADAALLEAERLLKQKRSSDEGAEFRPKTLRGAVKMNPNANVAVISVAGRYATDEAWDALRRGLHVLLFSDNVSLEDEIALKTYARDHGLLLMGPGAGTAILNGVALGFANVVPSGPVGIVSAAGTGLQEVSTLLAKHGVGITQGTRHWRTRSQRRGRRHHDAGRPARPCKPIRRRRSSRSSASRRRRVWPKPSSIKWRRATSQR